MKLKRWLFTEFSTTKKFYNLFLASLQWRFFKNSRVFTYPARLTICPGNVCNLSCVLCPTGQHDNQRKQGLMNFDLFKQIIDECGPYVYELSLFNWGEPLLNTDIFKMVRYAKQYKIRVLISTNLKHFNDTICAEFIHSGVDNVVVSLDGASQESVTKYQVGNDFEKIITNMGKLVSYKRKINVNKPSITWRFLINRFNEHEQEKAGRLSKKIGIDVLKFNKFRCDMGRELTLSNEEQYSDVKNWLPQDESLSMYDYSRKKKKKIKLNHCKWLWFQSSINWNGSVAPCCAVWNEKYDFGNVSGSTFGEIWNSSKYKEARRIVRGDLLESTENICSVCHSNRAII
jgi:radical SAM protein with 4Fe4S-binding SPASM domain